MSRSLNYMLGSILLILTFIVFREIYTVGVPLLIAEAGGELQPEAADRGAQLPTADATPQPTEPPASPTALPPTAAPTATETPVEPTATLTALPTELPTDPPSPTATDPPPTATPTNPPPTATATPRPTIRLPTSVPATPLPQGPWPTATPDWTQPTATPTIRTVAPQSQASPSDTNAIAWWRVQGSAVAAGNGTWRVDLLVRVPTSFQYTFDSAYLTQVRLHQQNVDGDDLYLLSLAGIGCGQGLHTELVARQNGARMLIFNEFATAHGPVTVDAAC